MTLPPGSDAGGTTDCCSVPTPTVIPSNRSKCHFVAPNRRRSVTTLPLPASGSLPSTLSGRDDRRYTLQWQSIGGRKIGRNRLPTRAVVSSFEQAWALLGVTTSVHRLDEILALAQQHPTVREWVLAHPHRALALAPEMPQLIAAYVWLDSQRGSRRYLREISARGVDTKFAERHRPELAAMLDVSPTAAGFLAGLGLRSKPGLVRLRPAPSLGLPDSAY